MSDDKLISIELTELMDAWNPGSFDHSWKDEHVYCWLDDGPRTNDILNLVKKNGIGFDDAENPVTLGNDGRVWDGHHRIIIARTLGIKTINVRKVT